MQDSATPGLLVRFRPTGPWRFGPDSGARDRVDLLYHSDTLYSACCSAFRQLGMLEEWLAATAGAGESGSCGTLQLLLPLAGSGTVCRAASHVVASGPVGKGALEGCPLRTPFSDCLDPC
jgi:hypothetical protein